MVVTWYILILINLIYKLSSKSLCCLCECRCLCIAQLNCQYYKVYWRWLWESILVKHSFWFNKNGECSLNQERVLIVSKMFSLIWTKVKSKTRWAKVSGLSNWLHRFESNDDSIGHLVATLLTVWVNRVKVSIDLGFLDINCCIEAAESALMILLDNDKLFTLVSVWLVTCQHTWQPTAYTSYLQIVWLYTVKVIMYQYS